MAQLTRSHRRMQKLIARVPTPQPTQPPVLSDPEWLIIFTKLEAGARQIEPDFGKALTMYREAIAEAERIAPEIDPPRDFTTRHPRRVPMLHTYRSDLRFDAVFDVYLWLMEMTIRMSNGTPPVTESEYHELATWYREHRAQLLARYAHPQVIDLGDGITTSLSHLDMNTHDGPRKLHAGKSAEQLRRLRRLFLVKEPA